VKKSCLILLVFIVAVGIALPMFWMGFILQKMIWLIPGLSVVLLARLLIPAQKAHGFVMGSTDLQEAQQNSAPT